MSNLTASRLRELLHYNPETGKWARVVSLSGRTDTGANGSPGWRDKRGRLWISVDGHEYSSHRLAFLYMIGEWPSQGVDHERGDPADDRWVNLREANQSQNIANSRKRDGTSSKFKGVTFDQSRKRWMASVTKNYRRINLGRFDTEEAAYAAYCKAAINVFGEFARLS